MNDNSILRLFICYYLLLYYSDTVTYDIMKYDTMKYDTMKYDTMKVIQYNIHYINRYEVRCNECVLTCII